MTAKLATQVLLQITDEREKSLIEVLEDQIEEIKSHQEEDRVVLPFLEMFVVQAACDDPRVLLMPGAVLPLLRKKVLSYASSERQKMQAAAQKQVCLYLQCLILTA